MSLVLAIACTLALADFADEDPPPPRVHGPPGTLRMSVDGHPRHKLDLFVAQGGEPKPLVTWVHGGASRRRQARWQSGLSTAPERLCRRQDGLLLLPGRGLPGTSRGLQPAVPWHRKHAKEYPIDPERLGAWDSSAGGYFVAIPGTTGGTRTFDIGDNLDVSSQVSCVVDFFGPTDFTRMTEPSNAVPRSMEHDSPGSPESQFLGGPVELEKEKAAKANPIAYVSKQTPPFLGIHGDQDHLVSHGRRVLPIDALKSAGVPVEFRTVKGNGQGTGFGRAEHEAAEAFLTRHLRP